MNSVTLLKYATVATLAGSIMACSSNPKVTESELETTAQSFVATPEPIQPVEITNTPRGPSLTVDNVLFDFEQATLRPEASGVIDQAAAYLKANPAQGALVEGHTDHTGDTSFNQALSEQRSVAIKDALTAKGVNGDRIKTFGLGESQPAANNETLTGRKANRRVEIIFQDAAAGL